MLKNYNPIVKKQNNIKKIRAGVRKLYKKRIQTDKTTVT